MTVQLQGLEVVADVIRKNYDLGEVGLLGLWKVLIKGDIEK
jgi:hypothetical protein